MFLYIYLINFKREVKMADKPSMQVIDKLIRNRIFNSRYWK